MDHSWTEVAPDWPLWTLYGNYCRCWNKRKKQHIISGKIWSDPDTMSVIRSLLEITDRDQIRSDHDQNIFGESNIYANIASPASKMIKFLRIMFRNSISLLSNVLNIWNQKFTHKEYAFFIDVFFIFKCYNF